jgi:hypothetical protein
MIRTHANIEGGERVEVFGGEVWIDNCLQEDYGIEFGATSISGISADQFASLASAIVNHMSVNGHHFELGKDDQYQTLIRKKQ